MKGIREIKISALMLVAVLFIFGGGIALAADSPKQASDKKHHRWVNIFPIGTKIHSFAIDHQDNRIYASTPKGLFISVDDGKLWFFLSGFKGQELSGSIIKISSISPETMYWGISWKDRGGSIWRSKNGGITWEDISAGVIKDKVYDIALHPKSPEIVYVASEGGLYKTLNGGKTWGKIAGSTFSVFLNPQFPEEVYASIEDRGGVRLLYSKDGGQNFDRIKVNKLARFGEKKCGENVHDSAFALLHPTDTKTMLAACNHGGGGQSILKSSDGGKTWEFIHWEKFVPEANDKNIAHVVRDIIWWSFHPKDKNVIYFAVKMKEFTLGGDREWPDKILKSTDFGNTWIPLPSPPQLNIGQIVALSNAIYVTTDYGVYKTTDDGKTWEPRSFGLPVKIGDKNLISIDPKGTVYVGMRSGFWTTSDKGSSWEWHPSRIKHDEYSWRDTLLALSQVFYTSDGIIYFVYFDAGGRDPLGGSTTISSHGVYKVISGQKPIKLNFNNASMFLAVSPSSSQALYAVATRSDSSFLSNRFFSGGEILLKSEDGGFSWMEIDWQKWLSIKASRHEIVLLAIESQSPNILYTIVNHIALGLGATPPARPFSLLKTTDGGSTWVDITRGLYQSIESVWTSSKWLNPKERHHIANLLLSSPTSVVIDPSNSSIVYITTSAGGVYRTDDGGKTWKSKSPVNYLKTLINTFDNYSAQQCKGRKNCKVTLDVALSGGIIRFAPQDTVIVYPKRVMDEVGLNFNNIAIAPSNPKTIYLATNRGVYRSTDRGDTWQAVNDGLLDTAVRRVMASTSLVLAEGESGIYKLSE